MKMKNYIKKIIVSILSLAVMGTVCTMAPVMAEASGTTPAQMYFDNTYQAWLTNGTNNPANGIVTAGIVTLDGVRVTNPKVDARDAQKYFKGDAISDANRPGHYIFESEGNNLTVALPEKAGYDIKTVGVVAAHYPAEYLCPFDYSYSVDGDSYVSITDKSYTKTPVANVKNYLNAFYETLTVPANAKYLKITRNSVEVGIYNSETRSYPGVMGFSFGYLPAENNDVIQVKASKDTEIINLLTSGLVDGEYQFTSTGATTGYTENGTLNLGLSMKQGSTMNFKTIEGYKITSIKASYCTGGSSGRRSEISLGGKTITLGGTDKADKFEYELTNKLGADSFSIKDIGSYAPGSLYDIVITMEKPKLQTSIDSAVDNGTAVTATATVSNLGLAEDASMELIVAGYDGDRFMGAQTKTVTKADADGTDSLTVTLPTGTKTVKVFLWKDLDTLGKVLAPVELAVTTAAAE